MGVKKHIQATLLTTALCGAAFSAASKEESILDPNSYTENDSVLYILPESFGVTDDRVKVIDSSKQPWSAIGRLDIGYELPCTGFLVTPQIVATAGHCAIGEKSNSTISDIEIVKPFKTVSFAPGLVNGTSDHEINVSYFYRPKSFHDKRFRDDFAFAVLDRPLEVEPMSLATNSLQILEELQINYSHVLQAGYSGDTPDEMTANISCAITHLESEHSFYHNCDTVPGDSGSPI
jgi:protease YdgD